MNKYIEKILEFKEKVNFTSEKELNNYLELVSSYYFWKKI